MEPIILTNHPAPHFELPDLLGERHRLKDLRCKVVVLIFWSGECPWSEKADHDLLAWLPQWQGQVSAWWIASNRNEPLNLLETVATQRGLPVVLHDAEQKVADAYGALTTPHAYVIDRDGILRYQGAVNDVTFRQRVPTQAYLLQAIEKVLSNQLLELTDTPPYGCTIIRY